MNAARQNGLTTHLKEAIELNRNRMPLYAKVSNGRTLRYSRMLIFSEQLMLPVAWILDQLSKPFQKAGIPIGDAEYISMNQVTPFSDRFPFEPEPLNQFKRVDGRALSRRLKDAYRSGGFNELSRAASHELKLLETPRAYHAMTRHLLESIIRAANLAPLHEQKAKSIHFRSPLLISRLIISGHFPLFASASKLDADLAPIQATGIPFLWQDVPHIPAIDSGDHD